MSNLKNLLRAFPLRPNEYFGMTYPRVAGSVTPINAENAQDFDSIARAQATGFSLGEMDGVHPLTWGLGETMEFFTQAFCHGLGVIVRNPMLYKAPRSVMSHPNVVGAIVERGAGNPADHLTVRDIVHREGLLPVWFVFDGLDGAEQCADQVRRAGTRGMSVYTVVRGKIHTVLTPVT